MKVIHPSVPLRSPLSITEPTEPAFADAAEQIRDLADFELESKVPLFLFDNNEYNVLVRDLALLWRLPSSYQVLMRMSKYGVKTHLKRTTTTENNHLWSDGLISKDDTDKRQFYLPFRFLLSILTNKEILIGESTNEANSVSSSPVINPQLEENQISINQVLPQYGEVKSTLDLNFSTFNALTKVAKFKFYKTLPMFQRLLPPSKLPPADLELLAQENVLPPLEVQQPERPDPASAPARSEGHGPLKRGRKPVSRRPLGKIRKYYTSIDPNTLDLTESLIPGQGYIQEFNINHLCKVPNYYASRGTQQSPAFPIKKPETKVLKNMQQLSYSELETTLTKYYYTKTHRGVGSGNYKDAAFANKLNRIPASLTVISKCHKSPKQLQRMRKRRADMNIKGLVHELFHNKVIKEASSAKRDEVEDHSNIEMLHANLQYNLLVNSYREIARETWDRYYEFKMTDFDQLTMLRKEQVEKQQRENAIRKHSQDPNAVIPPELLHPRVTVVNNIVNPTTYKEITSKLPLDLRNDEETPATNVQPIKKPIRLTTVYPNPMNSDLAFSVESVRVPNSNSIGWDNMKKYGEDPI